MAVITGGASGIGLATALLLRDRGASVLVGDVAFTSDARRMLADQEIAAIECDVVSADDVARLIDRAGDEAGGLDIVVNNAGVGLVKQLTEVSVAEWDRVLDINFRAAFLTTRFAIPHMRERGGGAIVNISSNAGLLPRAHDPVYSTSKGALIAMTKSFALCHAPDRIRVNAVCPGPVMNTGMMNADLAKAEDPMATARAFIDASPLARAFGRMILPEEVAQAVLYLVSDAAKMVTGTAIAIDGGKSLGVPPR